MNRLAIVGARVIDCTGAEPLADGLVLLEGERIAWIGPRSAAPADLSNWPTVDGKGRSLLPGLIDCHVHISADPDPRFLPAQALADSQGMAALRAARNARLTLEAGETTVRDMGGTKPTVAIDLGRAITQGLVPGPRILASGSAICMTGGHGWFIGREADGPEEVRKAAREQLKAGADVIKVMATGGVLTPGLEVGGIGLGEKEMAAAVEEAVNSGRRTAAHAIGTQGIKNALKAGIHSVEHGCLLDEECLDLLVRRQAFYVPTLAAVTNIVLNTEKGEMPEYVARKARHVYDRHCASFGAAMAADVRIAAGTDASTPYNPHGGVADEIRLMTELGMKPMDALRAATAVAAEVLGLEDRIGTLAVGKLADLVLVDGDPLADVRALKSVYAVVQGGSLVHRSTRGGLGC